MFVYKSAGKNSEYIVTLWLERGTPNNLNRGNVKVPLYAKYRCKQAKVIQIEHKSINEKIDKIPSYYNDNFLYEVGKEVNVEDYNGDNNIVCDKGIHFFLIKKVAFFYNYISKNGEFKNWCDNGQKYIECTYKNGELDGEYKDWYDNGQKCVECTYKNGELDGEYKEWYDNGQKWIECTYKNNELDGEYKSWYDNGQQMIEYTYKNGVLDGEYKNWYDNGQIWIECTYKNGELDGEYKRWHDNGQKCLPIKMEFR